MDRLCRGIRRSRFWFEVCYAVLWSLSLFLCYCSSPFFPIGRGLSRAFLHVLTYTTTLAMHSSLVPHNIRISSKQATARHVCSAPSSCMHINLVWPDQPDIHRIYIHTMPEPSTQNSAFNMQQYTQVARASKPGPKCDKVTFLCKSSRASQDPQQNGARHTTLCCSS
jgi:hypothetical protein